MSSVHGGQLRHALDLGTAGTGLRQRDVVGYAGRKQKRLLRHPADAAAQRVEGVIVQWPALPQDAALLRVILAQQQL